MPIQKTPSRTPPTLTPRTEPPSGDAARVAKQTPATQADAAAAAKKAGAPQPAVTDGFERAAVRKELGVEQLDAAWDKGDYATVVGHIDARLALVDGGQLQKLDGEMLASWTKELLLVQQRLITCANKLSRTEDAPAKDQALSLLQKTGNLMTVAFERTVEVADKLSPKHAVGHWRVYRDTMKKKGFHTPEARLHYFMEKAEKFIAKGGDPSMIKPVTPDVLNSFKSGQLLEFVVDAYDTARICDAEADPTPGHTLLAMGQDALTAGTVRIYKDDEGKISQAIIGTFSGHFRSPAEEGKHLARHLVAAGVPPEAISFQGGEAGGSRAVEVLYRSLGRDGAEVQRELDSVDAESRRYNPYAIQSPAPETEAQKPGHVDTRADKKPAAPAATPAQALNAAIAMRGASEAALTGAVVLPAQGQALAGALRDALSTSELARNPVVYNEAQALLKHFTSLDAKHMTPDAKAALQDVAAQWGGKPMDSRAADPADLISPRPVGDRRARIVATLDVGIEPAKIRDLISAGMNVARFNPAHGSPEEIRGVIARVRGEAAKMGREISIQIDLPGPKLRLGKFANPKNLEFNDIHMAEGDKITLTNADILGDPKTFPVELDSLGDDVKVGQRVFMNDGTVELKVTGIDQDKDGHARVETEVIKGGKVWDRKGINLPDSELSLPTTTDDDKRFLDELLDHVDIIAQSFTRDPADILELRSEMQQRGRIVPILAKIERPEAVDKLDRIMALADGAMVARGDLGVEVGFDKVPGIERRINELGNQLGKPTMVATEVFMSMAKGANRPTRGDVEGLYSAIAGQGADAVMLGKETSFPDDPGEVVRAAARVIETAEAEASQAGMRQVANASSKDRDMLLGAGGSPLLTRLQNQ